MTKKIKLKKCQKKLCFREALFIILSLTASFSYGFTLHRTHYHSIPNWFSGQQSKALQAYQASCKKMLKQEGQKIFWPSCRQALKISNHAPSSVARHFFESRFIPYQVTNGQNDKGLFTGYFEPTYPARLKPSHIYNVPIYGKPKNLLKVGGKWRLKTTHGYKRMPSREDISSGPVLKGAPILVWVKSKVDRFFMQVQGSASVLLPSGRRILLGYAAQNGHPYRPIGKYLIQIGALTPHNVSMQSIRQWLNSHPSQVEKVLNYTPSFVFFKKMNTQHPVGAQGVELTPGRSLAVDPVYTKLGTPVFLDTYYPKVTGQKILKGQSLQRLFIAQDVGGAIKSPIRGDIFWGSGKRASWLAGHFQSRGKMWVLKPRTQ